MYSADYDIEPLPSAIVPLPSATVVAPPPHMPRGKHASTNGSPLSTSCIGRLFRLVSHNNFENFILVVIVLDCLVQANIDVLCHGQVYPSDYHP